MCEGEGGKRAQGKKGGAEDGRERLNQDRMEADYIVSYIWR